MNNDGSFTYDTYLAHLVVREQRCKAELAGFLDAKDRENPGSYGIPELIESYEMGYHLGKIYLQKEAP